MSIASARLLNFIAESNEIEGINRAPLAHEEHAHRLLLRDGPSVAGMVAFVAAIQPGAVLRDKPGLNVMVGGVYRPPPGGPEISDALYELLRQMRINRGYERWAYRLHCEYESLHPFTDGNGRSGRALWLWMMGGPSTTYVPLSFLHHWYYQSLQDSDARRRAP